MHFFSPAIEWEMGIVVINEKITKDNGLSEIEAKKNRLDLYLRSRDKTNNSAKG